MPHANRKTLEGVSKPSLETKRREGVRLRKYRLFNIESRFSVAYFVLSVLMMSLATVCEKNEESVSSKQRAAQLLGQVT